MTVLAFDQVGGGTFHLRNNTLQEPLPSHALEWTDVFAEKTPTPQCWAPRIVCELNGHDRVSPHLSRQRV